MVLRSDLVGKAFHDNLADGSAGPTLVWVAPGHFTMGDAFGDGKPDEKPLHSVTISHMFAMAKYETTLAEFGRFVRATGYVTDAEKGGGCFPFGGSSWRNTKIEQGPSHPVVCVSWNDAVAYARWLSEQTGEVYRLPTEAEWEYAARAGSRRRFSWGDDVLLDRMNCWFCTSTANLETTAIVGSYQANAFDLHDLEGNVWEWVASEWTPLYAGEELKVSGRGPREGVRVMRGGSWYNNYRDSRVANRGYHDPYSRFNNLGFRVVRRYRPPAD